MTFVSRNGTRGGPQPNGRFMRWMNGLAARRIKKHGGSMAGMNALVLTTVGKKSDLERDIPLGWFPGLDGSWIVVAAAAGAPRNPAWYYNLAANPDRVSITIDRTRIPVTAEQLHGDERTAAWGSIVEAAPRFAQYETKTDRELPIIRLVRQRSAEPTSAS